MKLFDDRRETEGLTEEQERILKAHLKEQDKAAKKRKGIATEEEEEEDTSDKKKGAGGQPIQQQQWGGAWQQMYPGYMMPPGNVMVQPGYQQMGGQGSGQQMGGYGVGQQAAMSMVQQGGMNRGVGPEKKWRFPCDNCGNFGHWRHEVVCPKFSVYLARQQQAAAAYQQQGMGGTTAQQHQQGGQQQQQAIAYGGEWLMVLLKGHGYSGVYGVGKGHNGIGGGGGGGGGGGEGG